MTEMKRPAVVEGANSIKQTLKTALGTVKGDDPIDEEFGLDVFDATQSVPKLKREITRTLLHDDHKHARVDRVKKIEVVHLGSRRANVNIEVVLDEGPTERIILRLHQPV